MSRKWGQFSFVQTILFMGIVSLANAEEKKQAAPVPPPSAPVTNTVKANNNNNNVQPPQVPKEIQDKMKAEWERKSKLSPEQKKNEYIDTELKLLDGRYQECLMGYDLFKKNNKSENVEDRFWGRCKKQYLEEQKKFEDMRSKK